jgi:GNAT superfamily N-acetyltransferase
MTIREATFLDRAGLEGLLAAQLAEHEIPLAPGRLARAIDGVLEDRARGLFLLAAPPDGGEPWGVAYVSFIWALEHGGRAAWLEELYVRPAERGRGLGRTLLQAVVDACRAAGCAAIALEVEASHARAANLYRREGFTAHRRARWVRLLDAVHES